MDKPIISKELMESLLGRSLKEQEVNNFDLYLEIAIMRLDDLLCIKIEDLEEIPVDLQLLIARAFAVVYQEQEATTSHGINKKQIEDFSVSYEANMSSPMEAFAEQNAGTIAKYSKCQGKIISGDVNCGKCSMFPYI